MTAKSLLPLMVVALVGCRGDGWPVALGGKLHEIVEPSRTRSGWFRATNVIYQSCSL